MVITAALAVAACFVYYPGMNFLLYSGLPGGYKNCVSFSVCLMEEIRLMMMVVGIVIPVWQLQVVAFDLANNVLKEVETFLNRYYFSQFHCYCFGKMYTEWFAR